MNKQTIGILCILGASFMWAIEPIMAKLSYSNATFVETSVIRAFVVAITALFLVFVTSNTKKLRLNYQQLSTAVYIGIAATVFADLLYFFALTQIPVVNAVIIGHMQPIFIIFIGLFILKEEVLTRFDYVGIVLMMIGGVLVTTATVQNLFLLQLGTWGDVLVVCATIAWSTTALAMKKYLSAVPATVITAYRYCTASVIFLVYTLLNGRVVISNKYQLLVGFIVVVGTVLYYEGLKRIKTAHASAIELTTPFFAAIIGFLLLGEGVTLMQVGGIVLLFMGVYTLSRKDEVYV